LNLHNTIYDTLRVLAYAPLGLAIRFPIKGEPERQFPEFQDNVWEMLPRSGYGVEPNGQWQDPYELYLEEVPVGRWDELLSGVLEGLREHGLVDQAKIVRIEPDLDTTGTVTEYGSYGEADATDWPIVLRLFTSLSAN
jgi:hypothetical protein